MQIRNIKGIAGRLPIKFAGSVSISEKSYTRAIDDVLSTDLDISECAEVDVERLTDLLYCETDMDKITCSILAKSIARLGKCIKWKEGGK